MNFKYSKKDLKDPKKWWAVIKFLYYKLLGGKKIPVEDLTWQAEAIVFRGIMCPDCKAAGECVGIPEGEDKPCGCNWEGKSTDMNMYCSCGKWLAVKNKEEWENFKRNNRVKLGLVTWTSH